MDKPLFQELSVKVLGMAFKVHNVLGPGLVEHCYQEAFCIELNRNGIPFDREKGYALYYMGGCIGGYRADLVVDDKIILELKSVKELSRAMEAQVINHLRLSKVPAGCLMNFNGERVEWKRFSIKREGKSPAFFSSSVMTHDAARSLCSQQNHENAKCLLIHILIMRLLILRPEEGRSPRHFKLDRCLTSVDGC